METLYFDLYFFAVASNGTSLPRGSKTYVVKNILKTFTGGSTNHNIFLQIFACIALKVERPGPVFSFSRHYVYPRHPSKRRRQKNKEFQYLQKVDDYFN